MTAAFKTILKQMAAGELEHVYAHAVISVDKEEIVWDGAGRHSGSIAIYSRNDVEPTGTVQSLHPAVVMKESSFQGNSTLHYELIPGKILCQEEWSTDGILLCYNGGEYVIPLHIKKARAAHDSEIQPNEDKDSFRKICSQMQEHQKQESLVHREKQERIKIARLNLERMVLRRQGRKPERQTEILEQMTAAIQLLVRLKPDCIRYRLYETAAVLENGNAAYAAKLESRIRNVILAAKKQHCVEYCMLLYLQYRIASMQKQLREAAVRKQQLGGYIQNAMEKEPSDPDLVLLLCSDCLQLADTAPLDLWEMMVYVYEHGNSSPYLFFYGSCLLEQSQMERILDTGLDSWTGHCLYAGIQRNVISEETAGRAARCRPEIYAPYICYVYEALYNQYPSRELLSALCKVLIRCDVRSDRVFTYYEQAVESNLKIARLYDYYMYALPSGYEKPVNREILLYFALDEYINPQIYTRLALNVLQFYADDFQVYSHYGPGMQEFVKNQIIRRNWSEDLALLAGEILAPEALDAEFAQALIPMLDLVQVKADVPDGYQVLYESGIYKEPQTGTFKNGKVCLRVPGGNGSFHLNDRLGRRVSGVNLAICPLMQDQELKTCCETLCPDDETLLLLKTYAWITRKAFSQCDFRLCMQYFKDESLDENFRKQLLEFILMSDHEQSFENTDIQGICRYSKMMDGKQMAAFTEILIQKRYYTEAAGFLSALSQDSVDDRLLLELAGVLVQYPENETSTELINLLLYLFGKGILDDVLFQYLARNYQGKRELLIDLYKDCQNRNLFCKELNDCMLLRLLMEEMTDHEMLQELLISVVNLEQPELLIQAAMNRICHDYLCGNCEMEADVMAALQSSVIHSGSIAGLTVPCQLACLKYDHDAGLNHEVEHVVMKKMCQNMMELGMKLDFVHQEAMQFGLLAYPVLQVNLSETGEFHENLCGKVEEGQEKVWAEYYIDGEAIRYEVEASRSYGCLYAAEIITFAGEEVHYRFHCGEQVTDWKATSGWDYGSGQSDFSAEHEKSKGSCRYRMLQEIAVLLQQGKPADEKMKNYDRIMKLVDLIGK